MPEAARNLHHIKLGRNACRGVGVVAARETGLGAGRWPGKPYSVARQVFGRWW